MCSDEVKVFDGIRGSIEVQSREHFEDIRGWMEAEDSFQRKPYCYQMVGITRSGQTPTFPFTLWFQFYCSSDAIKFKLTFGGKYAVIPTDLDPDDHAE